VRRRDLLMQLRVEYVYDTDVNSWGFAVPALHIVGSADTRDAAREEAIAAIALDDAGGPTPVVPGAEIEVLDVTLRPSSAA
jgi:hypothetical protein